MKTGGGRKGRKSEKKKCNWEEYEIENGDKRKKNMERLAKVHHGGRQAGLKIKILALEGDYWKEGEE